MDHAPPDLWLVLDALHPALCGGALVTGARWPLPPGIRLKVGLRRTDDIRVPHAPAALLGGHTAYVLERREAALLVLHTGHIGELRRRGELDAARAPVTLVASEAVELLTVQGEVGLVLRLEAAPFA